jgi:hypothetical protein
MPSPLTAEKLAEAFHETYERFAPQFAYETRKESALPWEELPEKNKQLMIAVCRELLGGILATPSRASHDTALGLTSSLPTAARIMGDPFAFSSSR